MQAKVTNMDYIHIRPLVYREITDLSDFDIDNEKSINGQLYESLLTTWELNPKHKGIFPEILRLFNDAYFYLTIIFMVKRPLEIYPDICVDAGAISKDFDWHDGSEARELVVLCMLHTLLRTFYKNMTLPQQKLLQAINTELYKYSNPQDALVMLNRLRGEEEDVVYEITGRFESSITSYTVSKNYYTPRNIQEVIDNGEDLRRCLFAGESLAKTVDYLCKEKEQKLQLISRLLEPEKDGYGVMDSVISAAYRSLYEMRAELTGEPLPEKLPFERACEALGPPMIPSPLPLDREKDEEENKDYEEHMIENLNSEVENLRDENARLKSENDELRQRLAERGDESAEWIGCFDLFFHSSLNPQAIAHALNSINHPYFPKNERGFWWVFASVLVEIGWIPKSNYKMTLQWANLHFKCGWDWARDNQFKFNDINENIRAVQPSSKWDKTVTGNVIGDYYGALAKSMKEAFTIIVNDGKLMDRKEFIKPGCPLINNGRK